MSETTYFKLALMGMAPLLQVYDMPTSLKFYRNVLGFSVVDSSGEGDNVGWVLLRLNEVQIMLNTAYEMESRPPSPDPKRIESHGDTTIYFGCQDINAAYENLKLKGVAVNEPEITSYGWEALNLIDPDGYQLCFQWPLDDSAGVG
ncbi:MAG TPA: VOC family protein [Chryseosolibacter sp.]